MDWDGSWLARGVWAWIALSVVFAIAGCGNREARREGSTAQQSALLASVHGVVRDNLGNAVVNATLAFVDSTTNSTIATTISQPDGVYTIDVASGVYDIVVTPAPSSVLLPQTFPDQVVTSGFELNIVLVPSAGSVVVTGSVTPSITAVMGQRIICFNPLRVADGGNANPSGCADTSADGSYALALGPGDYDVSLNGVINSSLANPVPEGGVGDAGATIASSAYFSLQGPRFTVSTSSHSFSVVIPVERVDGHVFDADDRPVAGASVAAAPSFQIGFGAFTGSYMYCSTTTESDGQYHLLTLPGAGQLTATVTGRADGTTPVVVPTSSDVVIHLPRTATVTGSVTTNSAAVLTAQYICFNRVYVPDAGTANSSGCANFAADGSYALELVPGDYDVSLNGTIDSRVANPVAEGGVDGGSTITSFAYFTLQGARFTVTTSTNSFSAVIPVEQIDGHVFDADNRPVAEATVATTQSFQIRFGAFIGSYMNCSTTTESDGQYHLVTLPGSGELTASVAGRAAGITPVVVPTTSSDVVIRLPRTATVTGTVTTNGAAVLAQRSICFNPVFVPDAGNANSSGCANVASDGAYALELVPGDYDVSLTASIDSSLANPAPEGGINDGGSTILSSAYFTLQGPRFAVAASNNSFSVVIPIRKLDGRVLDADGQPVVGASIGAQDFQIGFGAYIGSYMHCSTSTDSEGRYQLFTLPGSGALAISPVAGSGLNSFVVRNVQIVDDANLIIAVQFLTESTSSSVSSGGTLTTDSEGNGATAVDPVETTVTSPSSGVVTIEEGPITEAPPSGYSFLTQEVSITAPAATAQNPLVIVFLLDGTRLAPGQGPVDVAIFRNGVLVPACSGSAGVASPDPCVSARSLAGDDVSITVLTSAASHWNFGVRRTASADAGVDSSTGAVDAGQVDAPRDTVVDVASPRDAAADTGAPGDSDGDGVIDAKDKCPATARGTKVNNTGCALEQLCPCAGPKDSTRSWRNHGAYVSCVETSVTAFVRARIITSREGATTVKEAAKSKCGNRSALVEASEEQ